MAPASEGKVPPKGSSTSPRPGAPSRRAAALGQAPRSAVRNSGAAPRSVRRSLRLRRSGRDDRISTRTPHRLHKKRAVSAAQGCRVAWEKSNTQGRAAYRKAHSEGPPGDARARARVRCSWRCPSGAGTGVPCPPAARAPGCVRGRVALCAHTLAHGSAPRTPQFTGPAPRTSADARPGPGLGPGVA